MLILTVSGDKQNSSIVLFPDAQNDLEQEAVEMVDKILDFAASPQLSKYSESFSSYFLLIHYFSINLVTVIDAITNIARQRSNSLDRILQVFETINRNYFLRVLMFFYLNMLTYLS